MTTLMMLSYFFLRSVATSLNSLKRRKHVLVWHEPETPWHLQTTAILSRTAWNRRKKGRSRQLLLHCRAPRVNQCCCDNWALTISSRVNWDEILFNWNCRAVFCCITVCYATHGVLISSFWEFGWKNHSKESYRAVSTLPLLLLCCKCDHSKESYRAAPSCGAVCYAAQNGSILSVWMKSESGTVDRKGTVWCFLLGSFRLRDCHNNDKAWPLSGLDLLRRQDVHRLWTRAWNEVNRRGPLLEVRCHRICPTLQSRDCSSKRNRH